MGFFGVDQDALKSPKRYMIATPMAQHKICKGFYKKLDLKECVNINPGSNEGTWCYVDKKCETLFQGQKLPNVNWKFCRPGDAAASKAKIRGDVRLGDHSPLELFAISKSLDLPFGFVIQMAYPGSRAGEKHIANLTEFIKHGVPVG